MALRRYRCPHCGAIEKAEPSSDQAVSVTCGGCSRRFRIPKAVGPRRKQTSLAQKSVKQQVDAETEQYRSEGDREALERIVRERRFGEYDILDELGRGGMGVVYKAFHRPLKRMVALKIVLPDAADQETMLKRFRREAELHARLSHPNIVAVYDSGEIDGVQYFAMDYITGTQLTKLIGSPEYSLRQRVEVGRQLADALEHAHKMGIVHRDIKPDNVIVDAGWKANLVDFGIAKPTDMSGMENITRQGLAIGTPHYMAPEQFRPKVGELGPRSDVYSLGAVLYHALCGQPPFDADSAHAVLIKAATQNPPPLEGQITPSDEVIPSDLAAIIAKCLKKKPDERYQSAHALADDLRRYLAGDEVLANPLTDGQRLRRKLRKHTRAVQLFGMVATMLLIVITGFLVTYAATESSFDDIGVAVAEARTRLADAKKDAPRTLTPALAAVERSLGDAGTQVSVGGRAFAITALVACSVAALLVLVFGYMLVVRPLRKGARPVTSTVAQPDELGATADEV